MSWAEILVLIAEEVGPDAAIRIEERARLAFGGTRVTVSIKKTDLALKPTRKHEKPQEAAKRLGVHRSTVYRRLIR